MNPRIALVVWALPVGGAERQVVELAVSLSRDGVDVVVLQIKGGGQLETELRDRGVRVVTIGLRNRRELFGAWVRLIRTVRRERPVAIYSFLTGPNCMALGCRPFARHARIVWSIRSTTLDMSAEPRAVRIAYRLEGYLARGAHLVVANSRAGFDAAVTRGWRRDRIIVIENGIDTDRFRPSSARDMSQCDHTWRDTNGIPRSAKLAISLGRIHPMKDHSTFIRAVANLRDDDWHGVIAGWHERPAELARLSALIDELDLGGRVRIVEPQDTSQILRSADVVVSTSSYGEGFSNVLAEATALGRPCVATDVGDARRILGSFGHVVRVGDAMAVADACRKLSANNSPVLVAARYEWIHSRFSVQVMAQRTREVLAV